MSPIKTARNDLPPAEGHRPDAEPRFVTALAQSWYDQYLADGRDERATANGSLLRGSDAGSCSRMLAYEIRRRGGEPGMERTNPTGLADAYRFGLGTLVHESMEAPLLAAFPGSQVEVVGVYEHPDLSLHADALITLPDGRKVAFELKTTGGYSYKRISTSGKYPAEGPKISALLQGALAAKAFGADELVIAYLSMELLSPAEAKRQGVGEVGRFGCEFTYLPSQFLPMADAELARMLGISQAVSVGLPVRREVPGITPLGAEVVDPATGRWELRNPEGTYILDSGSAWACDYCGFRAKCAEDAAAGQ